jgi:O-antigen/teichoic acid export membrane protein
LATTKKKSKSTDNKNYSIGEKIISNATYLFFDWFALAFFSFLFWFILGKTLSPSELGITSTSLNFIIFITGFSTLGVGVALQKLLPEIKEKNGINSVFSFVKLSIKPIFFSLLILLIFFLIFSQHLSNFIKMPNNVFLVTAVSSIIVSLYYFFGSTLYGIQNMKLYFLTDFLQVILKVVLAVLFVFINFSYFGAIIGFSLSHLLILFPRLNLKYFTSKTKGSYKKLFSFAFPALIYGLSFNIISNGSYIILTILKNTEVTGLFTIAFTITSTISVLTHLPNYALFPIVSGLSVNRKNKRKQGYLIGLVLRYSFFVMFPLSILLFIFSNQTVILFSKPEFLPSTKYFPFLVPAAMFSGFGAIFCSNLYAIGKPKIYRNVMLISAFSFLVSSLILTTYLSAIGLSLSYLIAMVVYFLLNFIYIRKYLKIVYFIKDIFKIVSASFIITLIFIILKPLIHNFLAIIIFVIPIGLLYLFLLLQMKFYRKEEIIILKFFGKKFPILGRFIIIIAEFIEKRIIQNN